MRRGIFILLCGLLAQPVFARDAEVGKPAPALTAHTMDGGNFSLRAQAGKVVIINFWASWCPPCRKEMPELEAYYDKHRNEGLTMLAISVDNPADADKARDVMKAYRFPAALIDDADLSGYGRIRQIPQTYIIDRHGILRRDGGVDKGEIDLATLEKIATPLLQAAPPQPLSASNR